MNTFSEVWRKLSNRKYRSAFARTQFKRLVPLQIQALRRQRGLSQEALEENEAMIAPGEQANAMAAAGGKQHADVRFGNLIILDGARTEMAGKGQSSLHGLECMLLTAKPRGGSANAASGGATR